jgi:hypothetical protein
MPRNKDDIPPRSYLASLDSLPYQLAHPPFDPVPEHCFADPSPNRKTKATVLQAIGQYRDHQQTMSVGPPLAPDALKVGVRLQTILPAHVVDGSG